MDTWTCCWLNTCKTLLLLWILNCVVVSGHVEEATSHPLRHFRKHQQPNDTDVAGDTGSLLLSLANDHLFSSWSAWSKCSRRCKQFRRRKCADSRQCQNLVLREERPCEGQKCKSKRVHQEFRVVQSSIKRSVRKRPAKAKPNGSKSKSDVRILLDWENGMDHLGGFGMDSLFFSGWSSWTQCTRTCATRRFRTCRFPMVCGRSVIREEAFCYVEGSLCERLFRSKFQGGIFDHFNDFVPRKPDHGSNGSGNRGGRSHNGSDGNATEIDIGDYECGTSNLTTVNPSHLKIIGGRKAQRGQWPWQVAILDRYKEAFCGGTLIAPRWILTAAHCVRKRLFIRIGEHDLGMVEGSEREYRVQQAFIHPEYDSETVDSDVALLKLPENVRISQYRGLACLPRHNQPLPDQMCVIIGWGKERNTHLFGTNVLHQAEVPIVRTDVCNKVYEDYHITKNMFCAGYRRGRVDSCAGDSGGPLLCQVGGKWTVFGITSFGEGCGKKGKYGIYAQVANYVRWVQQIMRLHERDNDSLFL